MSGNYPTNNMRAIGNLPMTRKNPIPKQHYGTPVTFRDYSTYSPNKNVVVLLKRDNWHDKYTLEQMQRPLKNDHIQNPLGMFGELLKNHPPRPVRLHPFSDEERKFMNEVVKAENKLFCPVCFCHCKVESHQNGTPEPARGAPGPWMGHTLRDNGTVTCPRLASSKNNH